jgi:hypothetical protein
MSVRTEIRDQAIQELNTDRPTDVPECTRRRFIPGEKIRAARLAAFFQDEDADQVGGDSGPLTERNMVLLIQAIVPVELPEEADDAIEPLLEHIVATLGDTKLSGKALGVRELNTLWATANDGGVFVIVALTRWRIRYYTRKNDLTKRA